VGLDRTRVAGRRRAVSLALRPYQRDTITAVYADWSAGLRRVAAVLPTGAGKTVIFANIVRDVVSAGRVAVVLAHRDELIEQAADKLRQIAPELRIGIFKAERRETVGVDVIVASVQSLARPAKRAQLAAARPRLVVVDETHHVTAPTYSETLRAVDAWADDWADGALVLGVTATLSRADGVALGEVIEKVSTVVPIRDLILSDPPYLLRPRGIRVKIAGLDLGKVRRAHGDFSESALGEAMSEALAPAAIVRAYAEHCADRRGLAFLPTVALAHEQAEAFSDAGIPAAAVDGAMPLDVRRKLIAAHRDGDVQVLCNCMVFTEGTDMPWVNAIVLGRPTSSGGLYTQMVGRGLRPYPGQADCVVLDVVGVTGRHRLATLADLGGAASVEALENDLLAYEEDQDEGLSLGEDDGYGSDPLPAGADGRLVSQVVDLFTASHAAWKRTRRGVWYLPAGDGKRYVFLAPGSERDRYHVAWCAARSAEGGWVQRDMEIGYAMSRGEDYATVAGGFGVTKTAYWRTGQPSAAQLSRAGQLGISLSGFESKGDVSDLIDGVVASSRLDMIGAVQGVSPEGYWT
jgi:superfamily II DNA or RNA helicase